ncbi:helix-turn-helix domain-containing protein [Niabella beijingensis]|uniref:helix-turn-helix domain-containing protein n=1 Tax=Niabella beijingensis TaxID=2872700 RepID=UPI001CBE7C0F|nr:AraC family transcriptional regulator [Niabella beijingensis]MBZ4190452.1 helix-turn-helix domain-containing protein [Niabella beijingensis]
MDHLFEITSPDNDSFFWSAPEAYRHQSLLIPSMSALAVSGGWGHMLFQHRQQEDFTIWYSTYCVEQRRRFKVRADVPVIEFSFLLRNSVMQQMNSLYDKLVEETQFNIFYLPYIEDRVSFEPGLPYTTLDIHCTPSFLQKLEPYYPGVVHPFLDAIAANTATQVFPQHLFATQNMVFLAQWILRLLRAAVVNNLELELAVKLLLCAALECKTPLQLGGRIITLSELSRVNRVSIQLLKCFTREPNLRILARQAGMNETFLKKLFALRFQQPPYRYWNTYRMDEAFTRVISTDEPLTDIALDMGFSALSNFSKTFKKFYGLSPVRYRK